jgi:transposase, IS5 family
MQMSFGSLEMMQRVRKDSTLSKVNLFINWEALRPQLTGLYKRESSGAGGQEPFDALVMFKAILLGQWHSLSDPKLEEALHVRIDFMQFCGLTMSDAVPDETTLCRFRNRLIQADKLDRLLATINTQLQQQNLMLKAATGAVIDATLIESSARPNKTITLETDQDGQAITFDDGSNPGVTCTEKTSVDPDATWLKKGKKTITVFVPTSP